MVFFSELSEIVNGKLLKLREDYLVSHLLYDSRKLIVTPSSVFFAIRSEHRDGHEFVQEIYSKGIRQFVIENLSFPIDLYPEANFILVNSSVRAMQMLASHHRQRFAIPVIGITGSNGKTIVKEWLSQLLSEYYRIIRSPKSFNSQIGVPLSVWQMNEHHELAIFEAGISKPGEMECLHNVIRPTIGIFTNLGPAHDEGFANRKEKTFEKLKLFKGTDVLIYNSDQKELDQFVKESDISSCFSWGKDGRVGIISQIIEGKHTRINLVYEGIEFAVTIPFSDSASIENVLHCISTLLYLKIPTQEIQNLVKKIHPLEMRMELKEAVNGSYVIDDAYNNDISGLTIAIQFLNQQNQRDRKVAILSDVLEAGIPEPELYRQIGAVLGKSNISTLIGIGPAISRNRNLLNVSGEFYDNTEQFLDSFSERPLSNCMILVKGARKFRFERIVQSLTEKVHGTVLEVNLNALSHNLNFYRSFLKSDTKIMVMVKAFAYGSGSSEVAHLLQFHKVDYLAVAYTDEGIHLRNQGITIPIMVMNPTWQSFEKMHQYNLEPEIYSLKVLNEYNQFLDIKGDPGVIHLKIDTGMHRLGFTRRDLNTLIQIIKDNEKIKIQSVFTHLAAADDARYNEFTKSQLDAFNQIAQEIERQVNYRVIRHALNSAGIVRFPDKQMDMVRLGIGLYGVEANALLQDKLLPVGTLKAVISQIKELNPGETVGYSRKGVVSDIKTIATIAIGYADGYDRRFSNGVGKVLVGGKLCPVIGNVCMDMCMIDISGTEAKEGDTVTVFGEIPSIIDLASGISTIPYEILTGVSERVKRVFYSE